MKTATKLVQLFLILCLCTGVFSGCGGKPSPTASVSEPDPTAIQPVQSDPDSIIVEPTQAIENEPTIEPTLESFEPIDITIPKVEGSAVDAAKSLAERLEQTNDVAEATQIIAEILTWAGVAVYDSDGILLQVPKEPASDLRMFDFQVYNLALDYINQGGISLGDLGDALGETETTVNDILISGDMVMYLFSEWIALLDTMDPTSWEAFTPAFFHELNLIKPVGVDLFYPGYDTKDVIFSNLEVALFAASHVRAGNSVNDSLAMHSNNPHAAMISRQAGNPCEAVTSIMEKLLSAGDDSTFGKWAADGANSQTGDMLSTGWEAAAEKLGGVVGGGMKIAGKGLGWLLTAVSGLLSMTAWEFDIRAEPDPVHYKHDENEDVIGEFVATIKVNEHFPRWVADCLKTVGQDLPTNADLSSNMIRWVAIKNLPPHGEFKINGESGRLEEHFSSSGEARISVLIDEEKDEAWKTAPEKHSHMTVRGELYRKNGMPGAEVLVGAMTRNVGGAVMPVLQGWWDKWFPMKAWGRMNVDYHKIVPMTFTLKGKSGGLDWTYSGYNCKGIYGHWVIKLTGSGTSQGMDVVLDGSLEGATEEGAEMQVAGDVGISGTFPNLPVNMSADITASVNGFMYIRGTKDNPVLVLEFDDTSGKGVGTDGIQSISLPLSGPGGSPFGTALHESPDYPACND